MPVITTDLKFVIQQLNQGKAVAIPTETVYGLAAMIDKSRPYGRFFLLKTDH